VNNVKVSVISPVLNEVDFIGFSIMAVLDHVHEIIYTLDEKSDDGTRELLVYIKDKYARDKLRILDHPTFNVHDMPAYNEAYNRCIRESTGDAVFFLHPDMLVTNPEVLSQIKPGPLAWISNLVCYAGNFHTKITTGRAYQWKNLYAKKFGIHYYGGYGSEEEDFYFKDITGKAYKHHNGNWNAYPYQVADIGLKVNHYCELKNYKRRLEKMKLCLKTLFPKWEDAHIAEMAAQHPRVTLEPTTNLFGNFAFEKTDEPLPDVVVKYRDEFNSILGRN
jgi:glycosyltransferase involved in cell wall biosynthesis